MNSIIKEKEMEKISGKFTQLESFGEKTLALNVMNAYVSGIMDERARWQHKIQAMEHNTEINKGK